LSSNLPEEKGGLGMDQVTLAMMVEEMGYAGLPEPVAEQIFLVNDVIPFLPKNITEAVESNYNDGTQYIALAHPLAPNPLFLKDAAGLILLDNSECKFIAKDDMDFEIISSNDPSRELFKVSSMNDAISTSENFDELNSAVSSAELACKNSIQAHGAMGYTWEMDLHIYMRKAWSMMACWGNEDKQQELIFKTLSSTSEELGVLYTF
jgi:hypothetical protein